MKKKKLVLQQKRLKQTVLALIPMKKLIVKRKNALKRKNVNKKRLLQKRKQHD